MLCHLRAPALRAHASPSNSDEKISDLLKPEFWMAMMASFKLCSCQDVQSGKIETEGSRIVRNVFFENSSSFLWHYIHNIHACTSFHIYSVNFTSIQHIDMMRVMATNVYYIHSKQ